MAEKTIQQLSAQTDVQDGDLLVIQRGGSALAKITALVLGTYLSGLITGVLKAANNLSDIGNAAAARGNLGLGPLAAAADVPTALGYTPANKAGDVFSGPVELIFTAGGGSYDGGQMLELSNGGLVGAEQRTVTLGTSTDGNGYIRSPHAGIEVVAETILVGTFGPTAISLAFRPTFGGNTAWDSGNFNPANYQPTGSYQPAGNYQAAGSYAQTGNNLSDLANPGTARTNLGLGSAATHASGDFQAAGSYQSTVLYGTGAPPALAAGQIYIQVAAV